MKNVLITGVSSGIGKAASDIYIEKGFKVIGIDKNICLNNNVLFFNCDITSTNELNNVVSYLKDNNINLDLIINIAGIHKMLSLIEGDFSDIKKVIDINLLGTMQVIKVFHPFLVKKGRVIIVTSEVASFEPLPFNGIYSISKIALESYAQSLRQELNLLGQKVITFRPGAVETPLSNNSTFATMELADKTVLFKEQSKHFLNIVKKFSGKPIKPSKLALKIYRKSIKKRVKYTYKVHQNFGLMLLGLLPKRTQCFIIKMLLNRKTKKGDL